MKENVIGLSMIVRNEEANLARCLESVRGLVDEIVIVDTGSWDRTVEVARRFTDKVFSFPWNNDFSAARNYALDKTHSQWVLYLDADEELDPSSGDIRSLIGCSKDLDGFFLPLFNQDEYSGNYCRYMVLRLFRNSPWVRFQGRIHEQVNISRPGSAGIAEGPTIRHRLVSGRSYNRKRGRNLHLLREAVREDPENPFLQYYLGIEWLGLGKPNLGLSCLQKACRDLTDEHTLFRSSAVCYLINCLSYIGKLHEAFSVCMEEALRYPSSPDIFFGGGLLLEKMEEYETAARWFKEALNCGPPPMLYSHTVGTESFLALHHLGHCHEKMGMTEKAMDYYKRALDSNPDYIYPLCNLFLTYFSKLGSDGVFNRVREEGHLNKPRRAETLSELFFEAGYPDLACACLKEAQPANDPISNNQLALKMARYLIYSGKAEEALSLLQRTGKNKQEYEPEVDADEIVALLLAGNYSRAKKRALELWRQAESRGAAWGLLNLVSLYRNDSWSGYPERKWENESIEMVLSVLDKCLLPRPVDPAKSCVQASIGFGRLARSALVFLTRLSPGGVTALSDYLKKKADTVRKALDARYSPAGRLYQ